MHSTKRPLSHLLALVAVGCASRLPTPADPRASEGPASTPSAEPASSATLASAPAAPLCQLYCEPWEMLPRVDPGPDYTQHEVDNANAVLDSMKGDLLACYKKRLRLRPDAQARITVDIVIGEDGHVQKVDTTGGGLLGDGTMGCIVHRIERGSFEPPHGGGTIHLRVPFALHKVLPGEEDST